LIHVCILDVISDENQHWMLGLKSF